VELERRCQKCGSRLTPGASVDDLCPRCALQFHLEAEETRTEDDVDEAEVGALALTGLTLDRKYHVEKPLGRGGMGSVFLATHLGTKRPVALKVISSRWTADPEFQARFRREAEALGRLRHPNVINVTDFGVTTTDRREIAYLGMEYLDGSSLGKYGKEHGPLPVRLILDVVEQVASALDAAHAVGVIHRDLKPENIWLEPNRLGGFNVKVLDFGIAKMVDPVGAQRRSDADAETTNVSDAALKESEDVTSPLWSRTQRGRILGTPAYMSPEQCRGEALDGRSDIYSLAVITYLLLAGDLPFQGTSAELVRQHIERQPAPLHTQKPGISRAVSRVVMSGLEKYPADRPATAAAFASLLRTNAAGERGFVSRGRAMTAPLRRVIGAMIAVNTLVGTVLALGAFYLIQRSEWKDAALVAASFVALTALLLMMGNFSKAACSLAFCEVLQRGHYRVSARSVLLNYLRSWPKLFETQWAALLRWRPTFARDCLWPVVCVVEDCRGSRAVDRSIALTSVARPVAASLTVRRYSFALLGLIWISLILPEILLFTIDPLQPVVVFQTLIAFLTATVADVGSLAAFPLLYFRGRRAAGEADEPVFASMDAAEFPGNRIPNLSLGSLAWLPVVLVAVGLAIYARNRPAPEQGSQPDSLVSVAELGRVRELGRLLAAGTDMDSKKGSWTALTRATLFGHEPVVEMLLDAGADVNAHNPSTGSALYLAVAARRDSLVQRLLDRGADPNLTPTWGLTPLMVAAMQGNMPVVRLLLARGADPRRRSTGGKSAVDLALEENHTEVAALIRGFIK
jgi:serine/threonine protein kinase